MGINESRGDQLSTEMYHIRSGAFVTPYLLAGSDRDDATALHKQRVRVAFSRKHASAYEGPILHPFAHHEYGNNASVDSLSSSAIHLCTDTTGVFPATAVDEDPHSLLRSQRPGRRIKAAPRAFVMLAVSTSDGCPPWAWGSVVELL